MKTIKNAKDASCTRCFFSKGAVLVDGQVVCENCGYGGSLIDPHGNIFQPVFVDDPGKMYQASPYTPPLPDRRKRSRRLPLHKERRAGMFV